MQSAKQISEVDQTVGRRVREARTAIGLTQSDLAERTGRSSQQIQKYESGQNRISAGLLFDLSGVLKQPISWFFGEHTRTEAKTAVSEFDECLELLHGLQHSGQLSLVKDFLLMMETRQTA